MKRMFVVLAVFCTAFGVAEYAAAQGPAGDVFIQEGIASWYGPEFDGRPTASGEIFDSNLFTAAHPSLPFGTVLVVTNRHNNRQVAVKVNDRGPFIPARIIDLSRAAAIQLDMLSTGTAPVIIESVERLVLPKPNPAPDRRPYVPPIQSAPPIPVYVIQPVQPPQTVYSPPPVQAVQPVPESVQAAQPSSPPQQITQTVTQTVPETSVSPAVPPVQVYAPVYNQQPPTYPPQQSVTPIIVYAPAMPAALPPAAAPVPPPAAAPVPPVPEYTDPVPAYRSGVKLTPEIDPEANKTYKIQVGSYKIPRNAVEAYEKLKNAGLNPSYERNEDLFRVVLLSIRGSEIKSAVEKLETAGFREALIREER